MVGSVSLRASEGQSSRPLKLSGLEGLTVNSSWGSDGHGGQEGEKCDGELHVAGIEGETKSRPATNGIEMDEKR